MAGYDLTNKEFGDFVAQKIIGYDSSQHKIWACVCKNCGKIHNIRSTDLVTGKKTKCNICSKTKQKNQLHSKNHKNVAITDNIVDFNEVIKMNRDVSEDSFNNITLINESLLNVPIYFKIAQAINADLSFSPKGLTGLLDKYFNIAEQLEDYTNVPWEVGEVIRTGSVYNLLTKNDRMDVVTYKSLNECLINLKNVCIRDNVKHLAIPRIGCGRDKLDFKKVHWLIADVFGDTDIQICIFGDYSNDPEYDIDYIESLYQA